MSTGDPKQYLLNGVEILDPVLVPRGFCFLLEEHAKGSGGWFAKGSYTRDNRALSLHFRYSLGLVQYHIGAYSLDHESYMRFLGVYGSNRYPDFPNDPIESFHNLAHDISRYCSDFFSENGEVFCSYAKHLQQDPNLFKGIKAM